MGHQHGPSHRQNPRTADLMASILAKKKKKISLFGHLIEAKSIKGKLFFTFPFCSLGSLEGSKCGHFAFACINILMSLNILALCFMFLQNNKFPPKI